MGKQEKPDFKRPSLKDHDHSAVYPYQKVDKGFDDDQRTYNQSRSLEKGSESDEISIKELILKTVEWGRYLLANWVIILAVEVVGGVAGILYASLKKPVYTAEITFVLESGSQGGGLDNYAGLASQFGINMGGGGGKGVFEGENFLALMRSRLMMEKALFTSVDLKGKRITLAEFYISINKFRDQWKKDPKMQHVRFYLARTQ